MGERERSIFLKMMRKHEVFSGLKVHSYCVLGNHFHLLVEVPVKPESLGEEEILRRMRALYSREKMADFELRLQELRDFGREAEIQRFFQGMVGRMHDLSLFMKELKQRFTKWFNAEHERKGTLWEERFRSLLVESRGTALMSLIAYIELNPVRAGLCDDPRDYRWSSLGAASSGDNTAMERLLSLICLPDEEADWNMGEQRLLNFMQWKSDRQRWKRRGMSMSVQGGTSAGDPSSSCGLESGAGGKQSDSGRGESGVSPEAQNESSHGLLRRIRAFTDGLVIGSRNFVEQFHHERRSKLCPTRKKLCHRISCGLDQTIFSYRRLNS
jgi:REP element-mobilizing transposase RayT